MGEVHTNVRTYQVDYVCDECQNGHMVAGKLIATHPTIPYWEHTCTNKDCGHTQVFEDKKYPSIQYQQIPIPEDDEEFELIQVNGYVDKADGGLLGEDEFWHAFIDFIESRGWQFGGMIKGTTDEQAAKDVSGDE